MVGLLRLPGVLTASRVSVGTLLAFHQRLLGNTRQAEHADLERQLASPDGDTAPQRPHGPYHPEGQHQLNALHGKPE